jgi:hypothetical protein
MAASTATTTAPAGKSKAKATPSKFTRRWHNQMANMPWDNAEQEFIPQKMFPRRNLVKKAMAINNALWDLHTELDDVYNCAARSYKAPTSDEKADSKKPPDSALQKCVREVQGKLNYLPARQLRCIDGGYGPRLHFTSKTTPLIVVPAPATSTVYIDGNSDPAYFLNDDITDDYRVVTTAPEQYIQLTEKIRTAVYNSLDGSFDGVDVWRGNTVQLANTRTIPAVLHAKLDKAAKIRCTLSDKYSKEAYLLDADRVCYHTIKEDDWIATQLYCRSHPEKFISLMRTRSGTDKDADTPTSTAD